MTYSLGMLDKLLLLNRVRLRLINYWQIVQEARRADVLLQLYGESAQRGVTAAGLTAALLD